MVQPKYSPEEALRAIKLRMSYDSSKTLNENVSVLKEQDMAADSKTIERELGVAFTDEQNIVNILKKYDTPAKFTQMLNKFKEVTGKELGIAFGNSFNPNTDSTEWNELKTFAKKVGYSLEQDPKKGNMGTSFKPISAKSGDADGKGFDALRVQKNINNVFCSVKDGIITLEGSRNKGKTWSSWVNIYKPTAEQLEKAKKSCGKKDSNDGGGTVKSKPKYGACPAGKYVRGCKSDVVKKVQACLEMPAKYHTGNFGPITQGELQKKFPDLAKGFTDKDVDVICKKTIKTVTTPGEEGVYDQDNA